MLYLTFRKGTRPDNARIVAATSDPYVVGTALEALFARLAADAEAKPIGNLAAPVGAQTQRGPASAPATA